AMLVLLSVLPVLSLVHFWSLFISAHIVTTKTPPTPIASIWSWSALTSLDDPARICTRYNVEPQVSCEGNITLLPGLEPTVFAVLTTAAAAATLIHWCSVYRSR